jgi:Transposase
VLLRHHGALTVEQQATRTRVCQVPAESAQTAAVLSRFRQVFHGHDPHALATWLEAAEQSGVPEVRAFVTKLRQDLPAVEAAVTLPWSQGPVQGQGNRLKLLKRSMYGRAKFDLLKQRALYRVAAAELPGPLEVLLGRNTSPSPKAQETHQTGATSSEQMGAGVDRSPSTGQAQVSVRQDASGRSAQAHRGFPRP